MRFTFPAHLQRLEDLSMTRVLVIDDDQSIRTAIEALLRRQDCVTVSADSARAGIKIFETSPFDLVMVAIFMPGMNGLETIKGFRERSPTVPILAMSGFRFRNSLMVATPDFLEMASKLGATYCLQKPFGPQQLMEAFNACLGARRPGAADARQPEQTIDRPSAAAGVGAT